MPTEKILVTGSCGQLGSELVLALRDLYGNANVIASDLRRPDGELAEGPFEFLDVTDAKAMAEIIDQHKITQIYNLAAILSAIGEQNPKFTWKVNMNGLANSLEIAREKKIAKIYWPSSIAIFGPETPKQNTPQFTYTAPRTVYGISKQTGEYWCQYFFDRYGVDVRSLRYPGLIGYKALPGGGTTDYAVDIYHKAIAGKPYECFLKEDTYLPMMYMPDAIRATLELMNAEASQVKIHTSYNLSAMSFCPTDIAASIQKVIPSFQITYKPDFRQAIADSWPDSIDDAHARQDWGWKEQYDLDAMTKDMILNLKKMMQPV